MEPLQNDSPDLEPSAQPDTGSDPGLAEATSALESVIGGGKPGAPERTQATAAPETPPAPKAPSRWDQHRQYQETTKRSWAQRQAHERARVREMQEERRLLTEQTRQANQVMQQMLDHLRAQQKPEEEAIPDALDPAFGAWWARKQQELLSGALDERLKPALEFIDQQRAQQAQQQEQRQRQAQQESLAGEITSSYQQAEAVYAQESPELAYGFHDRFETTRALIAGAFADSGEAPDDAQAMTDMWFHAIGAQAEARGLNKVAAIDGFITALAMRFGLEPVAPGDDIAGAWNGTGGNEGGYSIPPPRLRADGRGEVRSETSRLAAVQQRARAAAPAAPRVASRVNEPKSELAQRVREGVTDMKVLKSAALRDAHAAGSTNPMKDAAIALAQLAST